MKKKKIKTHNNNTSAFKSTINSPITSAKKTYLNSLKNNEKNIMTTTISKKTNPYTFDSKKTKKKTKIKTKTITDQEYKKLGVYLAHPNAHKRCFNCIHYSNKTCIILKRIDVSENQTCRNFRGYKTYLGGAFSPK